jgi:hypothetical protein
MVAGLPLTSVDDDFDDEETPRTDVGPSLDSEMGGADITDAKLPALDSGER